MKKKLKFYTSVFTFVLRLSRLSYLSKEYKGQIRHSYNRNRRNRTSFDIKHRCYLQRNIASGITYRGTYCELNKCQESTKTCINCRYYHFV